MITIDASAVVPGSKEQRRITAAQTIGSFLSEFGYYPDHPNSPHLVCELNGKEVVRQDWPIQIIKPEDNVRFILRPQGDVPVIGAIVGVLLGVITGFLAKPSVTGGYGNQRQGDKIEMPSADANTAKLGDPVPDIAGEVITYPDIIVPSRTYFVQDESGEEPKTVQWYEVGLCIGWGYFDKQLSQVSVGNTPFISLGDYADFQYHEPGEDTSGDSAFDWWHTSDEVGSTRTGDSGLELTEVYDVAPSVDLDSISVSGTTLLASSPFPEDWQPGLLIRNARASTAVIAQNQTGPNRGVLRGRQLDLFNPTVGLKIQIAGLGSDDGIYLVEDFIESTADVEATLSLTYESGAPLTEWNETGNFKIAIGTPGFVYSIVAVNDNSMVVSQPRQPGEGEWGGFPDQTWNNITLELDPSTRQADWIGPFTACPRGRVCTGLEVDLHAPQGIVGYKDNGHERDVSVSVEIQMRASGTSDAWQSSIHTYTGKSPDARGWTVPFTFEEGWNPEVRLRIASKDDGGYDTVRMQMNWYALKARMTGEKRVFPGYTTLGIRLQGAKRTAAFTDNKINCKVTRRLNRILSNGQLTPDLQGTDSPVDYAFYVLKEIGYEQDFLNMEVWAARRVQLTQRGDTYCWKHKEMLTAREIVSQALNVGFCDITFSEGKLIPVRDEMQGELPEFGISSQNMKEEMKLDISFPNHSDNDGVDVTYLDRESGAEKMVKCRLDGDAAIKVKKIAAKGITDRDRAWRFGMRRRREMQLRRLTYTAVTGLDARNFRWLTYLGIANDVPGFSQSGKVSRLEALNGGRVRVHTYQVFDWEGGGVRLVCFRRPDGSLTPASQATLVTQSASGTTLECAAPDFDVYLMGKQEQDPTDLLFGPQNRFLYRTLVDEITVDGGYADEEEPSMTITAVNYTDELYVDDDSTAPEDA